MQEARKAEGLAGAAGHLCSAYEELRAVGYEGWSGELRALIEIIDAEIEWLRATTGPYGSATRSSVKARIDRT